MSEGCSAVKLSDVSKSFGEKEVVKNLSFELKEGEITACLGRNGAGKSTTLRMMVGVIQPSCGDVQISGISLAKDPSEAKRLIGYVPDRPNLPERITIREYLLWISGLYGVTREEASVRAATLLEEYHLTNEADQFVRSLSLGMRQRTAIIGALMHQPTVLIVDEPLVGLDPYGATLFIENLRRYAEKGMCVLFSTHLLRVVETLATRVMLIHNGGLEADLPVQSLGEAAHQLPKELQSLLAEGK